MKVYLVQYGRGKYDSYKTFIYKICLTMEEAEDTNKKLTLEWQAKANVPCPVKVDKTFSSNNYPYSGDELLYWNWTEEIYYAKDFQPLPICEYEIDKEYIIDCKKY